MACRPGCDLGQAIPFPGWSGARVHGAAPEQARFREVGPWTAARAAAPGERRDNPGASIADVGGSGKNKSLEII